MAWGSLVSKPGWGKQLDPAWDPPNPDNYRVWVLEQAQAPFPGCRTCCAATASGLRKLLLFRLGTHRPHQGVRKGRQGGLSGAGPCVAGILGVAALLAPGACGLFSPSQGRRRKWACGSRATAGDTPGAEERQVRMAGGEGWTRQGGFGQRQRPLPHPAQSGWEKYSLFSFPSPRISVAFRRTRGRCGAEPAGDLGFRLCSAGSSLAFRGLCSLPVPGCSHQRGRRGGADR